MKVEQSIAREEVGAAASAADVDPITTEVIRHGLTSAAEQMKRALVRTAFSPVIYEAHDFAVAIYDRQYRMLAQALGLPIFMGTLSFCVAAAVEAVGGEAALEPGDIILYNLPYGSGSHPQDAAFVMPVFWQETELIGYTALKGHWLDIGGKEPYCTNTVDVLQEGTVFPGVKIYARGELVDGIYRMALANSRMPKMVAGDINAEVVGVRTGAVALLQLVERYGMERFWRSVEHMLDHGERVVRAYFEQIPDGRYVAQSQMDNNGVDDDIVPFEIAVEVKGSDIRIDYSTAPDQQAGPINCPRPTTESASRVAISMLVGGVEMPNEGHFRSIEVVTRKGSMFEPVYPAPCFLYAWPAFQAIEAIFRAIAQADPTAVPAGSGADTCALVWWGVRAATGEPWGDGYPTPVGQGGHCNGDGASAVIHYGESSCRFPPAEVWEARCPWMIEKFELVPDSGGAGQYRGGLGLHQIYHILEECYVTPTIERTKLAAWGLEGGGDSELLNGVEINYPDGRPTEYVGKATGVKLPKGATLDLYCSGGGGYGPPAMRDPAAVLSDIADGYVTEAFARRNYPHAFEPVP